MTRKQPNRARRVIVIVALLTLFATLAGGYGWLTSERRGDTIDVRTGERDAAAGAAEQVIDCVQDPAATPEECEAEAQAAQETLEQEVPPATLTKSQRREVLLIAARLLETQPVPSEDDVVDAVLAQLPDPAQGEQGDRGRRGAAGEDAEPPSTAEIRALVEAVYAANPPAPGKDGTNGATGAAGSKGEKGDRGETGAQGPAGPAGADGAPGQPGSNGSNGADGAPGRGIESITCSALLMLELTITYTDGTTQTVSCTPAE